MSRLFDGVNDVLIAGTQAGQVGPLTISAWYYNPASGVGTFPVPPVLDNFNRANGDPGANWAPSIADEGPLFINSNTIRANFGTVQGRAGRWLPATFSDPLDIYATLAVDGREFLDLYYCIQNPDSAAQDGYRIRFDFSSGTDTLWIERVDNTVATTIKSISQEMSAGDAFGLRLSSGSHQAYRKPSAGAWATLDTPVTDTAYTTGQVGIRIEYNTGTDDGALDDFGAGSALGGGGAGTDVLFAKGAVGADHEFSLELDWATDKFRVGSDATSAARLSSVTTLSDVGAEFVHLAATYGGDADRVWEIWVNGVSEGTMRHVVDPTTTTQTFSIGAGDAGTTEFALGRIAECAYWQQRLSAGEIGQLAAGIDARMVGTPVRYCPVAGSASPEPELVAADDFTVTGATLADHPTIEPYVTTHGPSQSMLGVEGAIA